MAVNYLSARLIEQKMEQLNLKNYAVSVACGVSERTVSRWRAVGISSSSKRFLPAVLKCLEVSESDLIADKHSQERLKMSATSLTVDGHCLSTLPNGEGVVDSQSESSNEMPQVGSHANQDNPCVEAAQVGDMIHSSQPPDDLDLNGVPISPFHQEILRYIRQASMPVQIQAFSLPQKLHPQLIPVAYASGNPCLDNEPLTSYERSLVLQLRALPHAQEVLLLNHIINTVHGC